MQLCFSACLVISSWWKFTDFTDSNRRCVAKRQGLRDPQDSQAPHTSAMVPDHRTEVREKWSPKWGATFRGLFFVVLNVIFQCWFPIVSALHSFVGKWNLDEFGPGPTCSKQTRSDWHLLEGHWDLLHFFSWGKGFLLSIRESWTVFVQAPHKFGINTLGQQRRKHIVLLQTLGINKMSSCCMWCHPKLVKPHGSWLL